MSAIIGGQPIGGPKRRFRWLRFRLRTALILVAVVCAWFGALSYRVQKMKSAIAAIRAAHGGINYECQFGTKDCELQRDRGPRWLRKLIGDEYFVDVQSVDFKYTLVRSDQLWPLRGFPKLRELNLNDTSITDLAPLSGLKSLRTLVLFGPQIDDDQMVHLAGLTELTSLSLVQTSVGDEGLLHLKKLTALRELYLGNATVTDLALEELQLALPNCAIRH